MEQNDKEKTLIDAAKNIAYIIEVGMPDWTNANDLILNLCKSDAVKAYHLPQNKEVDELKDEWNKREFVLQSYKDDIFNFFLPHFQQSKAKSEWINVSDKLPKGRIIECLCFNEDAPEYNQHVFPATWFDQNNKFNTNESYLGTITHWMLLQKKPDKQNIKFTSVKTDCDYRIELNE